MRKRDLAARLARQEGVSSAEAADHLDRVVNEILASLRRGRTVPLPGIGKLMPGRNGVAFEPESGDER